MRLGKVINDCLRIAKHLAPVDTGNLRENAIKITNRKPNGFTINYSYVNAYYIEYVNDGTENKDGSVKQKGQHFIEATVVAVTNYVNQYFSGDTIKTFYEDVRTGISYKTDFKLLRSNREYREITHLRSYEVMNKRYNEDFYKER